MQFAKCLLLFAVVGGFLFAEERTQRFDRDPGWEGHNNRIPLLRQVRQDFGLKGNRLGGFISTAAEPAWFARKFTPLSLKDKLSASGTLLCEGPQTHFLIGFFNDDTLNEWRTPNTIALRISPRGDVFYAWLEYATQRWRAGGDEPKSFPTKRDPKTGRNSLVGFATKKVWKWSLRYDPKQRRITASIGDDTAICDVREDHFRDGATFNRFGLLNVMKHADGGGDAWIGELTINDRQVDLARADGWDGVNHRRTYLTTDVRPRFDFGFSKTNLAGGAGSGELGGFVFRGDCRYPERMACYGDRLSVLTLDKPLRARGRVCLRRGVTDSTVLLGFYHSKDSMKSNPSQRYGLPECFLGVAIEGPSREGFFFSPTYRVQGEGQAFKHEGAPYVYPDGKSHEWSLEYDPGQEGSLVVTLGKQSVQLKLKPRDRKTGARFDRFGIVTTWIDGNGQRIYFDDLTYTCKQE